jgi:uncharacterized RDD family membrane protein YckC
LSLNTPSKQPQPGLDLQPAPGFLRRLAAVFYDLLLLIAVFFVATALLLPLNSGEAFTRQQFFYPLYLLSVGFIFYGWFWTHGGQTLGLKAWKLRVLTIDGKPINWTQAFVRYGTGLVSLALAGLGFFWIIFDKNQRGWHDYLSKTAVFFDAQKK